MKVIFIKTLKNQGKEGQIKDVSVGYAQNFLIPKGYAIAYTDSNKEILQKKNLQKQEKMQEEINKSKELKKTLEKLTLEFKVKTGENDQVFGSVSTKQISSRLKELGYDIDKKKIELNEPLTSLGVYIANIVLHSKVKAIIKINVIK